MAEGIAREGFDIDLLHGKSREMALYNAITARDIEVKSDGECRRTGNLFVEFEQRGRPSGLAVTTAHRWAFEYDDGCFLILPTTRLRLMARLAYRQGRTSLGGDYNLYRGVLLPVTWLVKPMGEVD